MHRKKGEKVDVDKTIRKIHLKNRKQSYFHLYVQVIRVFNFISDSIYVWWYSKVAKSTVIKKVKCLSRNDGGRLADKKTTLVDTELILKLFPVNELLISIFAPYML